MSSHFIWTLSLRLRLDTPDDVLAGVRYLLGLGPRPAIELPADRPAFAVPDPDDDWLPGGSVASMRHQLLWGNPPRRWGVYARSFVLDDDAWDLMLNVPQWLARWSSTQGWIGGMREELDLRSSQGTDFYAWNSYAYMSSPDGKIGPMTEGAPEFGLTQTTETST